MKMLWVLSCLFGEISIVVVVLGIGPLNYIPDIFKLYFEAESHQVGQAVL